MFAALCGWFLVSQYQDAHKGEQLQPGDNESYAHKLARYRAGADAALAPAITNAVVGVRAILAQSTATTDDNFAKWTATATVEFINPAGGVQRTNLEFGFDSLSGKPGWMPRR